MALTRYPHKRFATIELNHVSWPETARVFAQLPLDTDEFSEKTPCENGMWVVYDMAKGTVHAPVTENDNLGVVYNPEKEYNQFIHGMSQYALTPDSWYPRIGMPEVGDLYTTNCFQYDDGEFADVETLDEALADLATTPLYLVAVAGSAVPKITKTAPTSKVAAQVVKFYTVPNGEPGIKVQFVSC